MRDQRGFSIRDDPLAEMFGLKDVRRGRGREHTSSNTTSLTGVVQRELVFTVLSCAPLVNITTTSFCVLASNILNKKGGIRGG